MNTEYEPKTRIYSMNISGNLHDVARLANSCGWSDFLIAAECSGSNSLALFRFPAEWPFDDWGPLKAGS